MSGNLLGLLTLALFAVSSAVAQDDCNLQYDGNSDGARRSRRLSAWRVNLVEDDHALPEKPIGTTIAEGDDVEEKNPWSLQFMGIPINYFSVGLVYGGSVNLLYPVLIIQNGVTSSFFSAVSSIFCLVTCDITSAILDMGFRPSAGAHVVSMCAVNDGIISTCIFIP